MPSTAVDRRVAVVTYKLRGERIKAGLAMNPGGVILAPRQSGKTTQLTEYIQELHPEGVILFCINNDIACFIRDRYLSKEFFKSSTIVWGPQNPPFFLGLDQPIYADEICFLPGSIQKAIVRDSRFLGAASSAHEMAPEEVRNRCILV